MERLTTKAYRQDFIREFPGDESGNRSPRQTPGVLYSKAVPTPVREPKLIAWSEALGKELGIERPSTPEEIEILGGNRVTGSMYPYAARYAGHQFGNWAGQLGDGRAITLGEWTAPGEKTWELQLKGAGPTPYSRRADGRAVLRSSVREYLMSEAMHYLGIPTTRALSLVATGEEVLRDMFYDGRPAYEPGAIVMRVAPSFLRFGNFEMLAARGEMENLKKLTDWTIGRYYPPDGEADKILSFFAAIVDRTAFLMSEWMRVGFVHGVMNTDNMSILGLTIDYGPYSFVDDYDLNFTPNTTDLPGRRYAFGRQPAVAKWNLGCLAGALSPLLSGTEELVKILDGYDALYWNYYYGMMAGKLGLDKAGQEEAPLVSQLEKTLAALQLDMTIFFQELITLPGQAESGADVVEHFRPAFYREPDTAEAEQLLAFVRTYQERLSRNTIRPEESAARMRKANPRFTLRNYLLHSAIEGLEKGDDTLFRQLEEAIQDPYSQRFDSFYARRPDWAGQKAGCSMLSCSS